MILRILLTLALLFRRFFSSFCTKVRKDDPSILLDRNSTFRIRPSLGEKESIELAAALLENTSVTDLELVWQTYTKRPAEAMVNYVRTSKHLEHLRFPESRMTAGRELPILCYFLNAIQESTSLKELDITFPCVPSSLAFKSMLTNTQSLRSLALKFPAGPLENLAVAAVSSGLKENTTLRELTLESYESEATVSPILISLRDHRFLRRLHLLGGVRDLTGLKTLLLSRISKSRN
jgi:hypothetical protein